MADSSPRPKASAVQVVEYQRDEIPEWIREVIDTSLAIEQEYARSSGNLGFTTRALVSTLMPYKDPKTKVFERNNGDLSLTMLSPKGVPYGKYPRLLLSWLVLLPSEPHVPKLDPGSGTSEQKWLF